MKRFWKTTLLAIFLPMMAAAQNNDFCGTEVTPADLEAIHELREGLQRYDAEKYRSQSFDIPVQIHIIRNSEGKGGTDEQVIFEELDLVNDLYAPANIEFLVNKSINFIDSDRFFDYHKSDETLLAGTHDVEGALNIYFANTVSTTNSNICGYTHLPGSGLDRVFMAKGCAGNGSTLAHEIGHYLSLMHTHGFSSGSNELVDGSNCEQEGDLICDTPADPKLTGLVNGDCEYTGNELDPNGQPYQPDVENIMSYAPSYCRSQFTQEQVDQMVYSLQQNHQNLIIDESYVTVADMLQTQSAVMNSTLALEVYPNPSNGQFNITLDNAEETTGNFNVSVMSMNGQVVYQTTTQDLAYQPVQLDLSQFDRGIYLLNVVGDRTMLTQKLMYQ